MESGDCFLRIVREFGGASPGGACGMPDYWGSPGFVPSSFEKEESQGNIPSDVVLPTNSCYTRDIILKIPNNLGACSSVDRARGYEPRSRGFDSLLARLYINRIDLNPRYAINFLANVREIY
jgi:hypothetical protein